MWRGVRCGRRVALGGARRGWFGVVVGGGVGVGGRALLPVAVLMGAFSSDPMTDLLSAYLRWGPDG